MRCTYPRCRTKLRDGAGVQFVRPNGEVDRFCEKHAAGEWTKREIRRLSMEYMASLDRGIEWLRKEHTKEKSVSPLSSPEGPDLQTGPSPNSA